MESINKSQLDVAVAERPQNNETEVVSNLEKLQAYLAQYGEMIVESPRLPGVPLTLLALINACPKPPTEETALEFLEEAMALVAGASAKDQELEPKDEKTEKETDAEPELSKKKLN